MKVFRVLVTLVAAVLLAGFAVAGGDAKPVTVTGKLVCAKCTLQKDDAKECQNVIVAQENGKAVEYYLAKNALSEEFGHVCKAEKNVVATGMLSTKDGKTWITASKIDQPAS
jgi:hypothetical protein